MLQRKLIQHQDNTSKQFFPLLFQTKPQLKEDHAPTPSRWIFLVALEAFPSTREFHLSKDSEDKGSLLCHWLQLSPLFYTTVQQKLWQAGAIPQYPSLPKVVWIFNSCFDLFVFAFLKHRRGTGQQLIFYFKLILSVFCYWKLYKKTVFPDYLKNSPSM